MTSTPTTAPNADAEIEKIRQLLIDEGLDPDEEANTMLEAKVSILTTENERLKREAKATNDYLDSLYENAGVGHD